MHKARRWAIGKAGIPIRVNSHALCHSFVPLLETCDIIHTDQELLDHSGVSTPMTSPNFLNHPGLPAVVSPAVFYR